jgi:lantibiotic biosynthesis protein
VPVPLRDLAAVHAAAQQALVTFAAASAEDPGDAGPAILATALATASTKGKGDPPPLEDDTPACRALVSWLHELRRPSHPGTLCGGNAGRLLALRIAATSWPRLDGLAAAVRARLCAQAAITPWASMNVGWPDYDLVTGPAGVLLAFAADPDIDATGRAPLVAHLAQLCADEDLRGLRVRQYRDEKLRGWNYGRINMGLAHGMPGIVAALRASADADGLADPVEPTLRRLTGRLLEHCYNDPRGVLTWPTGSDDSVIARQRASRREAWCYGCPGIAWTLWEAGRVLGDQNVQAVASDAAASFIAAYDDDFYLDTLSICHGAAGLLVIFDAFSRHTSLPGADAMREHLIVYLEDRLAAVTELAQANCSLQSGASGVLLALLTAYGGDRRWLAAVALR